MARLPSKDQLPLVSDFLLTGKKEVDRNKVVPEVALGCKARHKDKQKIVSRGKVKDLPSMAVREHFGM